MMCPACGQELVGASISVGVCFHHAPLEEGWAIGNRIYCDFFHRKKVPPRLAQSDRDDDFWAHSGDAA